MVMIIAVFRKSQFSRIKSTVFQEVTIYQKKTEEILVMFFIRQKSVRLFSIAWVSKLSECSETRVFETFIWTWIKEIFYNFYKINNNNFNY